jgi:hypothetical protein
MEIKRIGIIVWLIIICSPKIYSQTYEKPTFALKSHETLEILKIDITNGQTLIYLSIENRIDNGEFCADKNIFIIYPGGNRYKLVKVLDIPECPDTYKFKKIGEKLGFTLTFPALKTGTKWIDLIEDCNDNCFSFYGILLDSELNAKIDEAVAFVERGEIESAIDKYESIIESIGTSENGISGSLYSDLISLLVKKGNKAEAETWYKKLVSSDVPRLQLYINNLNSRGIKF